MSKKSRKSRGNRRPVSGLSRFEKKLYAKMSKEDKKHFLKRNT